jgi:hypothetical protein
MQGIGICKYGIFEYPDGSMGGDCADKNNDFSYTDRIDDNLDIIYYHSAVRIDFITSLVSLALY